MKAGLAPKSEGHLLGAWTGLAVRPRLFELAQRAAAMAPASVSRRLPMVRRWAEGRELPVARGKTFGQIWDEGIE